MVDDATRRIKVFFYGLFMDQELLRSKGLKPTHLFTASVEGFRLQIGRRATLHPSEGSAVHGIVAALTHNELEKLYSDPSVRDYRPEAVLATLPNGEVVPALCYSLITPPALAERNPEYAAKLRALARRLEFPAAYVSSIQ